MQESLSNNGFAKSDIVEDDIWAQMPQILRILLFDRTTLSNIIWANDNYIELGPFDFAATAHISASLITGKYGTLIKPRALKVAALQKKRTKTKAEVFTPAWIVRKQNDAVDANYAADDLEKYVRRKWLEITCGEAPYMATRYDMETGELIPLNERCGFIDRKLARISRETSEKSEWLRLAELAFKAGYGFEWNGDSLLLARENLLYTYQDYHVQKWGHPPDFDSFEKIATIISYNVFQMDGLTYTIPLSERREPIQETQLLMFGFEELEGRAKTRKIEWRTIPGKRVKIMNWNTNKMEFFDGGLK